MGTSNAMGFFIKQILLKCWKCVLKQKKTLQLSLYILDDWLNKLAYF